MGYAEKRGNYYRGRFKIESGQPYGTVKDAEGRTIKFPTKRAAVQAADAAEVAVRAGAHRPATAVPTFGAYVQTWWEGQDLAASSMQNYQSHIEGHLLPYFGDKLLTEITRSDVEAWEKNLRAAGYAPSSVQTYRSVLHLILEDAVADVPAMESNPAQKRRGRGRRAGRSRTRGPEKVTTTPLGALLVAERAAILTGRDDEFIQDITIAYTGLRWGEVVGLDRQYVRNGVIQVHQQLYELDAGPFELCPPKDDSYRPIDLPMFLAQMLARQVAQSPAPACPCHGLRTVFRSANPVERISTRAIAQRAGVSAATVRRVRVDPVGAPVRSLSRVLAAMQDLGADGPSTMQPHWARDAHRHQSFEPAASGWFPSKGATNPRHPVCVVTANAPWPGTVVRGRYSAAHADACWAPVAAGLTPHGLRHCHATWLEDIGVRKTLIDQRMGHEDGSVAARYRHVTQGMRTRMLAGLTELWEQSLAERAALSPRSPVPVLDELLQAHTARQFSQNSPQRVISQVIRRSITAPDLHLLK